MLCLHGRMCATCVPCALGGQERALVPFGVNHLTVLRIGSRPSPRAASALISPSPCFRNLINFHR